MKLLVKKLTVQLMVIISGLVGLSVPELHAKPQKQTFAREDLWTVEPNKVICVTIPKCGTHLLIKAITLMDLPNGIYYNYDTEKYSEERNLRSYREITPDEYGNRAFYRLSRRMSINAPKGKNAYLLHLTYNPKYLDFFRKNTFANFLVIRDPRAQLCSLCATSLEDPDNRKDPRFPVMLMDLINKTEVITPWERRHGACDLMWSVGPVNFYKSFLKWEKVNRFKTIRFEDLSGCRGEEIQRQTIIGIADHLGFSLTEEKINYVIDNLIGGTRTYKVGSCDDWKNHFNQDVKDAYKSVPGACELLIDLGYETDCNW